MPNTNYSPPISPSSGSQFVQRIDLREGDRTIATAHWHTAGGAEGVAQLAQWIAQKRLRVDEHIVEGIDNAYAAFMLLFSGGNDGKLILKIA